MISKVQIEHNENGLGKITFHKKDVEEDITEPLSLSATTLEKLKEQWNILNFLDSDENYQSERDYTHLGTMKLSMKKDGRERTAEFNWTKNAVMKTLVDEYRNIGNKYVWIFNINLARKNQPLESPKLMRALEIKLNRNSISDPAQMLPFLKELTNDEGIPLISRNHASRLIKKIEKKKEKKLGKDSN